MQQGSFYLNFISSGPLVRNVAQSTHTQIRLQTQPMGSKFTYSKTKVVKILEEVK
jgi:hypothetical protein